MSDFEFSAAPHPLAKPGFGKVTASDETPGTGRDFTHLPLREAAIAAYLDRLPDGADISVKTLAAVLPLWGQCAVRTALGRLETAGHLHRVRERAEGVRWVTRTYFSRTARDGAWWARFTRREVPAPAAPPPPSRPEPPPAPDGNTVPSGTGTAYGVLADLGRHAPGLTLSKADCSELAPLADAWFRVGASPAEMLRALTAGLPPEGVHHPAAFVRRRLETKIPPRRAPEPEPAPAPHRAPALVECRDCRTPGRPAAFVDGLCAPCRHQPEAPPRGLLPPDRVRAHATRIREGRHT
ncbi:hypothetical protein [Streptomyces sp. NPDC093225]|uniref:hypothetical protein n=1 Tax=Streptomyces sp. NPDC093225 TaxID=3366034 RepID=UPI00380038D9